MRKIIPNFKKYLKDWLGVLTIIILFVVILVLYWYFESNAIFERGVVDWGDFGSILSAIAGLIAFLGILFTLKQNKQQFLNSEERSTFFELLKVFISYRDSLRVKKINWKYNYNRCDWNITSDNELCTPEKTYQQIYLELYHMFYIEIQNGIPDNISKDELVKEIFQRKISFTDWILTYKNLEPAINSIYNIHYWSKHGGSVITPFLNITIYDYVCLKAIKYYLKKNNIKPISNACAKAADQCFGMYKNQLGTYFNNAYNILDMVSDFTVPTKYFNIFRAQLSKNELTILFFHSFSSLATSRTRELYLKADLFRNLDLRDIRLKETPNDKAVSRETYIRFSPILNSKNTKDEYVTYDLLKSMYDCMDNNIKS